MFNSLKLHASEIPDLAFLISLFSFLVRIPMISLLRLLYLMQISLLLINVQKWINSLMLERHSMTFLGMEVGYFGKHIQKSNLVLRLPFFCFGNINLNGVNDTLEGSGQD